MSGSVELLVVPTVRVGERTACLARRGPARASSRGVSARSWCPAHPDTSRPTHEGRDDLAARRTQVLYATAGRRGPVGAGDRGVGGLDLDAEVVHHRRAAGLALKQDEPQGRLGDGEVGVIGKALRRPDAERSFFPTTPPAPSAGRHEARGRC